MLRPVNIQKIKEKIGELFIFTGHWRDNLAQAVISLFSFCSVYFLELRLDFSQGISYSYFALGWEDLQIHYPSSDRLELGSDWFRVG